jgi:hypothetical protein
MSDSDRDPSDALVVREKNVGKPMFVSLQEDLLWSVEKTDLGRRDEKWAAVTFEYEVDSKATGVLDRASLSSWAARLDNYGEEPETRQEYLERLYDDVAAALFPTYERYDDPTEKIPFLITMEFQDGETLAMGSML